MAAVPEPGRPQRPCASVPPGQTFAQPVEKWPLAGQHHGVGLGKCEPPRRIDLGKELAPATFGRPLEFEAVAHNGGRIDILFQRKDFSLLSARLPKLPQSGKRALKRYAKFLMGFAACGILRALSGRDQPLGNLPGSAVASAPEGTAGMDKQDLQRPARTAIQQDPGTLAGHDVGLRRRPASIDRISFNLP